jgi:2-iminobutanoate/2-iminopropanoate deaminase
MSTPQREVLLASGAPQPIGPYSVGIRAGGMVYASGSIGVDPATGELVAGGIEAETRQALTNLTAVLAAGGSDASLAVKTTVFLADLDDYPKMNSVYAEFFPQAPPARSAVGVARLPKGAAVEIEAIAMIGTATGD